MRHLRQAGRQQARPTKRSPRRPATGQRHRQAGWWAWLAAACLLAACSSQPVLYEGGDYAQEDIDACMRLAREAGADAGKSERILRDTAAGGAVGGAASGVYGAVRGYSDVGNRTAAGAAAGAAAALVGSSIRNSTPSSTFQGYVNRCLRERGYDVVGWN